MKQSNAAKTRAFYLSHRIQALNNTVIISVFLFENSQIYSMEKFMEEVAGYWNFLTFYLLMSWIWRVGNDDILFRKNYESG